MTHNPHTRTIMALVASFIVALGLLWITSSHHPGSRNVSDSFLDQDPKLCGQMLCIPDAKNGWKTLSDDVPGATKLLPGEQPDKTGACDHLQHLLMHQGAAIARVQATNKRVMFQTLVRPGDVSIEDHARLWRKRLNNSHTSAEDEGRKHMAEQVKRVGVVLKSLGNLLSEDFGTVWVLMIVEEELDISDTMKSPAFRLATFKYTRKDSSAPGAGGIVVNALTQRLSSVFGKDLMQQKCAKTGLWTNPSRHDYATEDTPEKLLSELYTNLFGKRPRYLAEKREIAHREKSQEVAAFVRDCEESQRRFPVLVGTCEIERALALLTGEGDRSRNLELSPHHSFVLTGLLKRHGVRTLSDVNREDSVAQRDRMKHRHELESRFKKLQDGTHGSKLLHHGTLSLKSGSFDSLLLELFRDSLARGKWVCFRMAGLRPSLAHVSYNIFPEDTSNGDVRRPTRKPRAEDAPLKPDHDSEKDFDNAMALLQSVEKPQTLCVHRFRVTSGRVEKIFDVPITWRGKAGDIETAKIINPGTLSDMMNWLKAHEVLTGIHCSISDLSPDSARLTLQGIVRKLGI